MAKKTDTKQPPKQQETTVEFLQSLAGVLVIGLFIITFILQMFEIPTGSMENTLLVGDHVFVNRVQFAPRTTWLGPLLPYRQIHDGDIFVFLSPQERGMFVVKRVIGVPGDRIHLRDGVVYRNGQRLNEPYVIHSNPGVFNPYADNFPSIPPGENNQVTVDWQLTMEDHVQGGDLVVPPDKYFAMGDNRDASYDSRYWGFVPRENVIGRPMFIFWSFETPEGQWEKTAAGERIGFFLHTVLHFFDGTRWRRTFKRVR